jgi:hypothetical protein
MGSVRAIAIFVLVSAASAQAQEPRWTVDITPASYVEAWDRNERRELLIGMHAGIDRVVWRGVALRGESILMHVVQAHRNAWVGGATMGVRARRGGPRKSWYLDLGGGRVVATERVPPRGTRVNYALLVGSGVELTAGATRFTAGGRWFHLSNNGSAGRARNPDIQALGGYLGWWWRF